MNTTAVAVGILMFVAGAFGLRYGWRKNDQATDRIIQDIHRISRDKPGADLDSDATFVKHRASATGWLTLLAISLALIVIGGVLVLANLS